MTDVVTVERQKPKRLDYLDVARGIGMLLVVIGHSTPDSPLGHAIFAFHMPLFFIISGMLYRKKRNSAVKDLLHLIVPYAATVALVFVFRFIRLQLGMSMFYRTYTGLIRAALFGSGSPYRGIRLIGEIWFLLALFWARRLMDLVFRLDKLWARCACVAAMVALGAVLAARDIWLPLSIDVALMGAGFMMAGWLIANRTDLLQDNKKRWIMLAVCLAICCVGLRNSRFNMSERRYGELAISLPTAVAASLIVIALSQLLAKIRPIRAALAFIGRHSLLFMCIHSLDWRMPVRVWGASLIRPYKGMPWYWVLSSIRRFSFDLAVMCGVLLVATAIRWLYSRKKPAA